MKLISLGVLTTLVSAGGSCWGFKTLGSKYSGDFCEKSYPNEKDNCLAWGKATIAKCAASKECDKAYKTGAKACGKAVYAARKEFWAGTEEISTESLAGCYNDLFSAYGECATPVRNDYNAALPASPAIEAKEFKAYLKKYQKAAIQQLRAEWRAAKRSKKSKKRSSKR